MRLRLIAFILILLSISAFAEEKKPMSIRSWTVSPILGDVTIIDVDTVPLDYQHHDTGDGYRSPRGNLGNFGSPSYSKIFFLQRDLPNYLFSQVYEPYFLTTSKAKFYNTTIPLTNISYLSGGSNNVSEERFKVLFTANAGKRLNVGAEIDNIYARGFYASQAVSDFSYRVFSSYISDKYVLHGMMGNSNLSNQENGGISDDDYITDPTSKSNGKRTIEPRNIPVNLDQAWNRVNGGLFFLTHRYNVGFYRTETKDTVVTKVFVPVSSLIHTFEYNNIFRRFIVKKNPTGYFDNSFINKSATNDTTSYQSYRNTVALSLREGFNKFAFFGLSAYLQNVIHHYNLMDSTGKTSYNEQSTYLGGELSRKNGKVINYQANAELGILGNDIGQFSLSGKMETRLRIFKKDVIFTANGYLKNMKSGFYLNNYHSNHFWWDQNLKDERRVRLEAKIAVPEEFFSVNAGVENLQNYIYFNDKSIPTQESNNVQVISGCLAKDFKVGSMHLDNEIYGQFSSNDKVIPLPTISLYHNLYMLTKLAKVLTLQAGIDVRYHSAYYAMAYQPAISQFHTQSDIKIGNYPLVCIYANLQLKRTRFFIMYYHANQGMVEANYFSSPHYPIDPIVMKTGISWNFNN